MPCNCSYFGLTGQIAPAKPLSAILFITWVPMRSGRSEAPKMATEPGSNKLSIFLILMGAPPAGVKLPF